MRFQVSSRIHDPGFRLAASQRCAFRAMAALAFVVGLSGCTKAKLVGMKQPLLVAFSITSIVPNSGPKAGGTTVSLTGTGFKAGMVVTIGRLACAPVVVLSATSATCVTSSSSTSGSDVVAVTNGDGASNSSFSYTYLGALAASGTRIAAGGNALSQGGSGASKVFARTSAGPFGNSATGGAGVNQVTLKSGVIGIYLEH